MITYFVTHRVSNRGLFDSVWRVRGGRSFLGGHHEDLIMDESYLNLIQSELLVN